MKTEKNIVLWGQGLVILNAVIWMAVGIVWLLRQHSPAVMPLWVVWGMGIAMIGYGGALLFLGVQLRRQKQDIYLAAVALISIAIIAGLFDDLGLADLLGLLPGLVALIYLWIYKNVLSGAGPAPKGNSHDAIRVHQG